MANVTQVLPGDLIRAEYFNELVDRLQALEARVSTLEGGGVGGAVVIDRVVPTVPRIGNEMTIEGRNFGFTVGAARVAFATTPVTSFKSGSSDSRLVLDVPDIAGFPQGGDVLLTARNHSTTATRSITVLPRQVVVAGDIDIHFVSVDPRTIGAGAATFHLTLESRASLPLTLTVTPTLSVQGWGTLQVLDANEQPIGNRQIQLASLQTKDFYVRVPSIPENADGTKFTLTVVATGHGISTTREDQFEVGGTASTPDPDIQVAVSDVLPSSARTGTNAITLRVGASAEVIVLADLAVVGLYDVTLSDPDDWTVQSDLPSGSPSIEIKANDRGADGWAHVPFSLFLTPTDVRQRATLGITVKRQGAQLDRKHALQLTSTA